MCCVAKRGADLLARHMVIGRHILKARTASERADHNLIDGKRRKRIARGSGTSVQEVNQVLKQYADMRRMMKQYGSYAKTKMRGLGKFAGMKVPPGIPDEN